MKQKGQALIILLMIILVALTVGLAITQRSISDLAQSNRTEQSTRAFSAAESGIEQALGNSALTSATFNLGNQSTASVRVSQPLPRSGQALEYPPIGRDTVAQFWLANPNDITCATGICYPANKPIDIYFGAATLYGDRTCCQGDPLNPDTPAIEINIISLCNSTQCPTQTSSTDYVSTRYFIDPIPCRRTGCAPYSGGNNFTDPTTLSGSNCPPNNFPPPINTSNSQDNTTQDRPFRCKVVINTPSNPIMIRARVLYSNASQPIAVGPDAANCSGCSLPPQAYIYTSVGSAGQTQRKLQVFKLQNVVPQLFDFAIFSASDIQKPRS